MMLVFKVFFSRGLSLFRGGEAGGGWGGRCMRADEEPKADESRPFGYEQQCCAGLHFVTSTDTIHKVRSRPRLLLEAVR